MNANNNTQQTQFKEPSILPLNTPFEVSWISIYIGSIFFNSATNGRATGWNGTIVQTETGDE